MLLRRVVITGMGSVSPYGRGVERLFSALQGGESGVRVVSGMVPVNGLRTRIAAIVPDFDPHQIERKHRRSMSRMSMFAALACQDALLQAGVESGYLGGGSLGVSLGSTVGSPDALYGFMEDFFTDHSLDRLKSTLFFQIMNHSCASNVAQMLGISGRILAPSAACATGCQAIGYGAEMIAMGKQEMMLCGGADEFHPLTASIFDVMNALSTGYNESPSVTPRPFDRDRDGLVCGEGSGILFLESLESAQRRGVEILAEVAGFATMSDPTSIANPNAAVMAECMRRALDDAGVEPHQVDYVNAHATATLQGDRAESEAIHALFGANVPVSSLKGHIGHTMAASGALESIAAVEMMKMECLVPTLNLVNVDTECSHIRHVRNGETPRLDTVIKNNFALGGVNSSIVLRRYLDD